MSKTIPIWTCVLNRAIQRHRNRNMMHENGSLEFKDEISLHTNNGPTNEAPRPPTDWDCSLHLPLWVSKTEKGSIGHRLEEFTSHLEESGADIASLAASLRKPLRPLWISQMSVIWLNEVPDHDAWDFTPIILVTASSPSGFLQQRTSSEFSWSYIPGAGDDEESWARGLTPVLFWNNVYDLINAGPDMCNQRVADIVEKDRVFRARRGQDAPQIAVRTPQHGPALHSDFEGLRIGESPSSKEHSRVSWLGLTNVAVGTTEFAASSPKVDCILNCDKELLSVDPSYAYLHIPTLGSKFDRFSLLNNLASAVKFARSNLVQGKSLLVCCCDGEDLSICVCLAILISLFNEEGCFDDGNSFKETQITKEGMRRRLVYICKFSTNARPSRGNLKQVFGFLCGNGRTSNS